MSTIPPNPLGTAFTNKTVPAPPKEALPKTAPPPPVEERFIPDSEIVAKPLRDPDFINMKPKNKNMAFFWGNRAVGDKESKMRFNQLQAKGFVAVKPSDIEGWDPDQEKSLVPDSLVHEGRVIFGDLILMMIPRKDYVGQQKWNEQTAIGRMRKKGIVATVDKGEGTSPDDGGRLRVGSVVDQVPNKVSFYNPPQEQADLLTGKHLDRKPDI